MDWLPNYTRVTFENMDGYSGEGVVIKNPNSNPEGLYYLINLVSFAGFGWKREVCQERYEEVLSKYYWNVLPECITSSILPKTKMGNTMN